MRTEGKLFVYRDPKRSIVPGRITRNTLAHASPSVSRLPASPAPDRLTGTIGTQDSRKMDVVGFLDTSAGRVYSAVHTEMYFNNQQSVRVTAWSSPPSTARTRCWLAFDSRVAQGSVRVLGGTVLESDASRVQYPFAWDSAWPGRSSITGEGSFADSLACHVVADQIRFQVTDQWRGATRFSRTARSLRRAPLALVPYNAGETTLTGIGIASATTRSSIRVAAATRPHAGPWQAH